MGLRLLKPPLEEPVTLEEAKGYLRVDGNADDALIKHLIKAARQAVEAYTNRCLIKQTWCFEVNAGYASARADDHYVGGMRLKGQGGIELPRAPFIDLQEKPCFFKDHKNYELTSYRLDTQGVVARLHVGCNAMDPKGFIRVIFHAGYGETPEEVPYPFKQAILMLVTSAYEHRSGANEINAQPLFMNEAVTQFLAPYRLLRLS